MKNTAIAKIFSDIADLLDMKGENTFKIRAYRNAARAIKDLPEELEQMVREGQRLEDIPGIGPAIAKKIAELVTTGSLRFYDELRSEFPEGIGALLDIPGIGPKTAMRLVTEFGIQSVSELRTAILDGRFPGLPHVSDEVAENILRHIQAVQGEADARQNTY